MKKKELVEKLKLAGSVSASVFINVSEVITMIEDLEESESSSIPDGMVVDITQEIVHQLDRNSKDVITNFDIDTDVRGNNIEISISEISFDSYEIECIVENAIEKFINKEKEESSNN